MSRYKLPHYIFITLPWAAVLTARFLSRAPRRFWIVAFYLTLAVMLLVSFLLVGFIFPTGNLLMWAAPVAATVFLAVKMFRQAFPENAEALVQRGLVVVIAAVFVLNFHFYPNLLPYQSTSTAAHFARENGIPVEKIAHFRRHGHALDFYAGRILPQMDSPEQIVATRAAQGELWLYTTADGKEELEHAGVPFEVVASFNHFQVALLKPAFLDPATRPTTLRQVYLLKVLGD